MNQKSFCTARFGFATMAALAIALATLTVAGCSKQSSQSASQAQQQTQQPAQPPANAKVYHLHGKVLSIDQANKSLMIDGDEIPGFMAAMTMPYPVKSKDDLAKVNPGDEITADIIIPQGDASPYIQNVVVVKKGTGTSPAATSDHEPQPGDTVPDFALIDQNGRTIHLSSYRGDALLITFIYTRCPFKNFCPLVSHNFAQIYTDTKSNPQLSKHMRLLSVSFDPDHDTPAALRQYAKTFNGITQGTPYARWEFAVIPKDELHKVTDFFGVTVADQNGTFVHSMSTSVITPDGKIYSWREDTDWQPNDLIADATAVLSPTAALATPADMRGAGRQITPPTTN